MRMKLIGLSVTVAVLGSALVPALGGSANVQAHSAPPCNNSGDPGNSDYAQHHIVALATEGGLGNDGHKPGTHMGFSLCLGVH